MKNARSSRASVKSTPRAVARFSKCHCSNGLLYFGDIHHHDGVPRASIQVASVWPLADTLLAADTQNRVHLNAPEGRMIFIRNPEHTIFYRAIFHTSGRPGAAGAALRDHREFLGFF